MNKEQRKQLTEASELMTRAKEIIDTISEEEQNKYDNLSEGLQATEANQKLEANADSLNDLSSELEDCINTLDGIIND